MFTASINLLSILPIVIFAGALVLGAILAVLDARGIGAMRNHASQGDNGFTRGMIRRNNAIARLARKVAANADTAVIFDAVLNDAFEDAIQGAADSADVAADVMAAIQADIDAANAQADIDSEADTATFDLAALKRIQAMTRHPAKDAPSVAIQGAPVRTVSPPVRKAHNAHSNGDTMVIDLFSATTRNVKRIAAGS